MQRRNAEPIPLPTSPLKGEKSSRRARCIALVASLMVLASCGGGGGGGSPAPAPAPPAPPPAPAPTLQTVSPATPFAVACNGTQTGTLHRDAEVEPSLAVDPLDANTLVASWQQDRWSNGGSQGIVGATSTDGGATWTTRPLPFSVCAGGTVANAGDFDRASNPWTAISRNGSVQQLALAFTGVVFGAGSQSAMLASRSTDHGVTWGQTATLVRDGAGFFNDKGAIATDPADARFVYATWDRLVAAGGGPSMLARSVDNGITWSTAATIYDPGTSSQTIGNVVVVLPGGTLVDLFTQVDFSGTGSGATQRAFLAVIRSTDRGVTWSAPSRVADLLSVGTRDPQTGGNVRDAGILAEIASDATGKLVVTWQDARFSNGARDAIAFSRSTDAGLTWSTPVAINGSNGAAAFDPVVAIRGDGAIAIAYYDLRDDTADATTLLTGFWLARSTDQGRTWTETRLAGPFDLNLAPRTDAGLFLGDYEALVAGPSRFVTLFAATNDDPANPTDIVASNALATLAVRDAAAGARLPDESTATVVDDRLRAQASDALGRALATRRPGWSRAGNTRNQ